MDNSAGKEYEVIIIGGGPAGLSAAIYTSRARLSSLLIERGIVGGQIINAELVENYPGFPEGISGIELTQLMHQQATKYGLATVVNEVTGIRLNGEQKIIRTTGGDYPAGAVIIANGSERQKLGIPGEAEFTGRGVSYCATCDAAFFREMTVAVVGGGNSALTEAIHLSRFASRVVVIHRRDQLRATRIVQEKAMALPNMEFLWDTVVESIEGDDFVQYLKVRNVKSGQQTRLDVSGFFISIGIKPNTGYLNDLIPMDAAGAVITNDRMETEIPGIFAAGDIRHNSVWQVIAAAGDGAIAAIAAEKYLTG